MLISVHLVYLVYIFLSHALSFSVRSVFFEAKGRHKIAEEDLRLRCSSEFFGKRQYGLTQVLYDICAIAERFMVAHQ